MTPQDTSRAQSILNDPEFRRAAAVSILVLVAYYFTAKVGFEFALQPGSVSTLWMPNSLLLAGLLLTSSRFWWVVILAALPAHLASELQSGVPTAMVLSWFLSNSLQAWIGAFLIYKFVNRQIRFDRLRDVSAFLILGAFLAPFLSSFLDSGLVRLNGWGEADYWDLWRLRFLSNALATLTLVPFVLSWADGGLPALKRVTLNRLLESGVLLASLIAVGILLFNTQNIQETPSRLSLPLPFLVWATVRFGMRGTSSSLLVIMFLTIIGATRHTGPFVTGSASQNALSIQAFLIMISVPLTVLAVVMEERRTAEASARNNEERLKLALNAAQMQAWDWQFTGNKVTWSETNHSVNNHEDRDNDATLESFYEHIHPEDRPMVESTIACAIKDGTPYEVEFRVLQNGETRWFLGKGKVFNSDSRKPSRMLGVRIDITSRKETERALASTNARNQAILRAIPDTMFLQNKDGVYLEYYTRHSETLLVPPTEFLGKKAAEVLPKDLADKVHEVIARLRGTDEPQVLEYTLRLGNEDRHFEARMVKTEGDNALSIVRDVTETRRATEAVRRSEKILLQSTLKIRALAAQLINAQDSERRRISILLHDDVSQNVAALGLAISRLKRKIPNASEPITSELDKLGSQVHDLTAQIRQLSHQLHPEILEQIGLVKALESHVIQFSDEEKIAIKFSADVESYAIPPEVAACLYRVALEAIRNVSKHSGAKSATVNLKESHGFLELEVSDSGGGFDVDKAKHGIGLGLVSSEERIRLLQGTFDIRSSISAGTCLTARVPFTRAS